MQKNRIKAKTNKISLPTVGFCFICYNDEKIIEDCLKSIYKQNYPKDKIQIIFMDGGSTDHTIKIIKKYGARVILRPDLKNEPNLRGELVASTPKTDLIVSASVDNRFHKKDCIKKMIQLFSDPEIVGVQSLRYGFEKNDPVLSRYFALIGGADPIAVGLGKADRGPYDKKEWHAYGNAKDKGSYFKVSFSKDIARIPTLGGNGFVVRRNLVDKVGGFKNGLHTDTCVRLIQAGHNKFAFVKNSHIIHYIDMPVLAFLKRRILWANAYSSTQMERDYHVFVKQDWYKLLWIIFAYTTIIFPLIRAIRGYLKKPDPAWFLGIIICPAFVLGYGISTIKNIIKKI